MLEMRRGNWKRVGSCESAQRRSRFQPEPETLSRR
jgi:hypothetical protein